jgi:hypothetical protein
MAKKDSFSKLDKFNLGLGIFNVIALIASIIISIWSINKSELIAEKSGAFDKGEVLVGLDNFLFTNTSSTEIYYGIKFSDSTMNLAILPFTLNNTGKKTVENVNTIIEYPHNSNLAIQDSIYKFEGALSKQLSRKFFRSEPYDQISYDIQTINPNNTSQLPDLFYIPNATQVETTIPVITKDNKPINLKTKYSFSYIINFHLTAKDIISKSYRLLLFSYNISDKDLLIEEILKEKKKKMLKESISDHFFVIIPTLKEKLKVEDKYLLTHNSKDIYYCQFDKEFKTLMVTDNKGEIKIIKLEK